jgi:Xaa-Pro aminopeptidase
VGLRTQATATESGSQSSASQSRRAANVRWLTPEAELERRWSALRAAMARTDLDCLLVHAHVDALGGYVKYFCDLPASGGYPLSIVFPADAPMTLVTHGGQGEERRLSPTEDSVLYGVERIVGTSSFVSASYTSTYDAAAVVGVLRAAGFQRVGLVGLGQMPFGFVAHLQRELSDVSFPDAADVVDPVKAVKSDYERAAIMRAVELQVAAFEAALDAIAPGRSEWEVAAAALRVARDGGSEHGPILVGSAPPGQPAIFKPPRQQVRRLKRGDRITILVEPSGPDGMYAELGRTIALGSADDELLAEHELAIEAWRTAAAGLAAGVDAADAAERYNTFLRERDRPEERRIHCHGQGYDIVERPLVRADESMTIEPGMLIALHPMWVHSDTAQWLCDNVFIDSEGASAPLHGVEQKVFVV